MKPPYIFVVGLTRVSLEMTPLVIHRRMKFVVLSSAFLHVTVGHNLLENATGNHANVSNYTWIYYNYAWWLWWKYSASFCSSVSPWIVSVCVLLPCNSSQKGWHLKRWKTSLLIFWRDVPSLHEIWRGYTVFPVFHPKRGTTMFFRNKGDLNACSKLYYSKHSKESDAVCFFLVGLPFIKYEGWRVISGFMPSDFTPSSKIQFMMKISEFIKPEECGWNRSLTSNLWINCDQN